MPFKLPLAAFVTVPAACFLYLYDLSAAGMLGPDEPRYAAIGREMARSGDWITPRLWGQPWFEKPVLLYWMSGCAFRLGFGADLAPRLPVALLTLAFLAFYWWILRREFGLRAASFATAILATSAAWLGFGQVGVTDMPLAATFSAAILLALPWVARGDPRYLPAASASLGFAVLAKSLVPLVLAFPLAAWWILRRRKGASQSRRPVRWPAVVLPFLAVVLPWHILCYLRNGRGFLETLFVQHQFGRFVSGALQHVQPWWFYLPVLAGFVVPWTALVPLLFRTAVWRDPRRRLLLVSLLFGLLFFSAATNKLPGYILPLLPAAAALLGVELDETGDARWWLAACALLLVAFPIAAPLIPQAGANGLSRAALPQFRATWLLPAFVAALAWFFERTSHRASAVFVVALGAACGTVYLKRTAAPELDRVASARPLWRAIGGRSSEVCVANLKRDLRYGLNYYSVVPLPECSTDPRPLRIDQVEGRPPELSRGHPHSAGGDPPSVPRARRPHAQAHAAPLADGRRPAAAADSPAASVDRRGHYIVLSRFREQS